jgi:hypothetical protein
VPLISLIIADALTMAVLKYISSDEILSIGTFFVEQNQGALDEPFARPYLQPRGTFYRYYKLQRFLAP